MDEDPPSSPDLPLSPVSYGIDSQVRPVRVKEKSKNSKTQIACLACRTVKVRCSNAELGDTNSPCARCIRLNITCEYKPHRRGRKPANRHAERDTTNSTEEPTSPQASNRQPTFGTALPLSPIQNFSPSFKGTNPSTLSFGARTYNSEHSSSGTPKSPTTTESVVDRSNDDRCRPFDSSSDRRQANAGYHDPPAKRTDSRRSKTPVSRMGIANVLNPVNSSRDPIDLGILSEADAMSLFSSFFKQLNPFIALLDAALHTHSNVRYRSSLLFSAVLAAAAKIIRPDLYQALLEVANDLLYEAMHDGACNIELVQAISILSFYKEPHDSSCWRKIGYAIRLAFELDLHISKARPLPSEEIQAREVLNQERTWIQLSYFDRVLSTQYQKPAMITEELTPDVLTWALDHKFQYPCRADATLASHAELQFQLKAYKQLRKASSREPFHYTALLDDIHRQQMAWKHRWIDSSSPPLELSKSQRAMLKFKCATADLLCAEARFEATTDSPATSKIPSHLVVDSLGALVSRALDVLRVILDLFVSCEWLRLVQDQVIFDTAGAGVSLAKRYSLVNAEGQSEIRSAMESIIDAASKASRHEREAPAYLARFFKRLLKHICGKSINSRVVTPPTPLLGIGTPLSISMRSPPTSLKEKNLPELDSSGGQFTFGDNLYWQALWPELEKLDFMPHENIA